MDAAHFIVVVVKSSQQFPVRLTLMTSLERRVVVFRRHNLVVFNCFFTEIDDMAWPYCFVCIVSYHYFVEMTTKTTITYDLRQTCKSPVTTLSKDKVKSITERALSWTAWFMVWRLRLYAPPPLTTDMIILCWMPHCSALFWNNIFPNLLSDFRAFCFVFNSIKRRMFFFVICKSLSVYLVHHNKHCTWDQFSIRIKRQ